MIQVLEEWEIIQPKMTPLGNIRFIKEVLFADDQVLLGYDEDELQQSVAKRGKMLQT
jgi:hypothetical protein